MRRLRVALALAACRNVLFAQTPGRSSRSAAHRHSPLLVEGNTLLTQQEIDSALAPFSGKDRDFGDIQRALEALEQRYRDAGWGVVQVSLPEQEHPGASCSFACTEARLGKVAIEGNKHFSDANVRRSVPSLVEGETPNLARNRPQSSGGRRKSREAVRPCSCAPESRSARWMQ
jgi:hypothetical protein